MDNIKSNYIAYIVVYVFISLINMYLLIYFPLYFYDVFKVDKNSLAFTQIIPNSMVILSIFFGYLFDKYLKRKRLIISISCMVLYCSFLLFIVFRNVLFWFGLYLSIGLLMRTIIQTGMSKLMFQLVKSNGTLKKSIVLVSNASASLGSFIPTIIFTLIVRDLYSLSHWSIFFLLGWIISFPILLTYLFVKEAPKGVNTIHEPNEEYCITSVRVDSNKSYFPTIILMVLIYISNFLFWSSNLFGYPLSSWVANKFGENAFTWFSSLYIVFFICNMGGYFLAKYLNKTGNERKIIIFGVLAVVSLFLIFPLVNFPLFVLLYTLDSLIYGIVGSNFVYLIIDISRKGEYENLKYQIMQSSSGLANIIFTPIGIILSSFLSTGLIMVISAFLVLLGTIPLIIDNIWKFSLK